MDEYLAQAPGLLNMMDFGAKLLERGEMFPGLPIEASLALKRGIEQPYSEKDSNNVKHYQWQMTLPATTTWLMSAGRIIYRHCLGGDDDKVRESDKHRKEWDRAKWDMQRWELWKTKLHLFSTMEEFNGECRDVAAQTVKKMLEVEAEHHA